MDSVETPATLRPYLFLGVDVDRKPNSKEASGTCPFCGLPNKFSINVEKGTWQCFRCKTGTDKGGGNVYTFIRKLWEESTTNANAYAELQKSRGLLNPNTLITWGIRKSLITDEWIVPAYGGFGKAAKMNNLYSYRYDNNSGKHKLLALPGITHQVFGGNLYDPRKSTLYVCEGPWDACALYEALGRTRKESGMCVEGTTGTLLNDANVIGIPGCNVFNENWIPLFGGRKVVFMYDNDHPSRHPKTNKRIEPASYAGMRKATQMLAAAADNHPESVHFLKWGVGDHDPGLPHGYDIRDYLSKQSDFKGRAKVLGDILHKVEPIPDDWVTGRSSGGSSTGSLDLECLPCDSWKTLQSSWRKAMHWTPGLEKGLTCMLAVITSTKATGDQLWMKIIGPPSCLAADTRVKYMVKNVDGKIVNKKGGTIRNLYARFKGLQQIGGGPRWVDEEVTYYIQSVTDEGAIYRNLITDVIYKGRKQIYRLTTRSGKQLKATLDHEIMTVAGYKPLGSISVGDTVMVNNGKCQPKGRSPMKGYRREVRAQNHPRARIHEVKQGNRLYKYSSVYRYWAVYEAEQNNMPVEEYLRIMNDPDRNAASKLWTIPTGFEIHHIDEDPTNDDLSNLMLVDQTTHKLEHHSENMLNSIMIYVEEDVVVSVELVGVDQVFDIAVAEPYHNFVAEGIVVHNCGKSVLCEAVSTSKKYIKPLSTMRGFQSGYKTDKEGEEDNSLIPKLRDKTLVVKDGDTLLQLPNLSQVLSEARDLYDGVIRSHYRNKIDKEHKALRITWLLCGTESLRSLDSSELGERFVDCVLMNDMDPEMEDDIGWRVAMRADRDISMEHTGKADSLEAPEMVKAKQLTGGYIEYLRGNAPQLLSSTNSTDRSLRLCQYLAQFVSFVRARPSTKQEEKAQRELSFRLTCQFVRLSKCLAVVLNKPTVDDEVMERVRSVALDTARGRTLELMKPLYHSGDEGATTQELCLITGETEQKESILLRFMRKIGALERFAKKSPNGRMGKAKWRLTTRMKRLFAVAINDQPFLIANPDSNVQE